MTRVHKTPNSYGNGEEKNLWKQYNKVKAYNSRKGKVVQWQEYFKVRTYITQGLLFK